MLEEKGADGSNPKLLYEKYFQLKQGDMARIEGIENLDTCGKSGFLNSHFGGVLFGMDESVWVQYRNDVFGPIWEYLTPRTIIVTDTAPHMGFMGTLAGMDFAQIQENLYETEMQEGFMYHEDNKVYYLQYGDEYYDYIFCSPQEDGSDAWLLIEHAWRDGAEKQMPESGKKLEEEPVEKLLALMQSAAQHEMEDYRYVDMDHDGACELIGVYLDEEEHYQAWYCSSDGQTCEQVYQNDHNLWNVCRIEILDIGEETHIVLNCMNEFDPWKTFSILALRDNKVACILLDQYGSVRMTDEGDIALNVVKYDGEESPDGGMSTRTWKDTYLFYDGDTYKEYGATKITEETFLTYQNAQTLKDKMEEELRQPDTVSMEYSYFKRRNGIIHIQCDVQTDSGVIKYGYYTVRYEGNVLEEELGEYNPGQMWESLAGGSWPGFWSDGIEVVY